MENFGTKVAINGDPRAPRFEIEDCLGVKKMSTTQNKWMLAGGIVLAGIIGLWLRVPPTTLLLVGVLLLCPAAMYFGMRGTKNGSNRDRMEERKDRPDADRQPKDHENRTV